MSNPTALYRFYDADNQLLYVGITENIPARWNMHANDKLWWRDVTRKLVEWHDDREAAAAAEVAAIRAERPFYNVVHTPIPRANKAKVTTGVPTPPIALPFYNAVMTALGARRMNKKKLHEITGVARSTIDGWQTQTRPPYAEKVLIVADALGIEHGEALRLAGIVADPVIEHEGQAINLSDVPAAELLAELARRIAS